MLLHGSHLTWSVTSDQREEVPQKKEVDKLLTAEFIKKAHYPNSLARVVLVKKS